VSQCDVALVDRDGRLHRLVQEVQLVVSAYEDSTPLEVMKRRPIAMMG
jgi:hypothetical protein